MKDLKDRLKNRKVNSKALLKYGFKLENKDKINNQYIYKTSIGNNQFELNVIISDKDNYSKLIDLEEKTEFILADIENAEGQFIGQIKQEYDMKINEIFDKCTTKEVFKSNQALDIINYIEQKYKDKLEFLWEKFDNNAIWRNKQNNKWYGILLLIPKSKLEIESDDIIEVIDLRYQKEKIGEIIDNKKVFAGYHINKKSWITFYGNRENI